MEEAEWAIEVMKATGKPVAMCLSICTADLEGVPIDECAVRIAKAGISYQYQYSLNKILYSWSCFRVEPSSTLWPRL